MKFLYTFSKDKHYVYDPSTNKEFIYKTLPINDDVYVTYNTKFCKQNLPNFKSKLLDIKFLSKQLDIEVDEDFRLLSLYKEFYPTNSNCINIVPKVKLLEHGKRIYDNIKEFIPNEIILDKEFLFYNNEVLDTIVELERNPLKVDLTKFPSNYIKALSVNKLYSDYNVYNVYSRPSNSKNGFNIGAMSKKDDTRASIIPVNDYFVEFDYTSYQMHLLSIIIDYNIGENDLYKELGELYQLEDRDSAKLRTMQLVFGESKINPYPSNIFLNKVFDFKNKVRKFVSPISGKDIKLLHDGKDLSRILQVIETEKNFLSIKKIQNICKNKKSFLTLYCYDSFLIDYNKEDGEELLDEIQSILETETIVTKKIGKNYKELN